MQPPRPGVSQPAGGSFHSSHIDSAGGYNFPRYNYYIGHADSGKVDHSAIFSDGENRLSVLTITLTRMTPSLRCLVKKIIKKIYQENFCFDVWNPKLKEMRKVFKDIEGDFEDLAKELLIGVESYQKHFTRIEDADFGALLNILMNLNSWSPEQEPNKDSIRKAIDLRNYICHLTDIESFTECEFDQCFNILQDFVGCFNYWLTKKEKKDIVSTITIMKTKGMQQYFA